MENKIASAAIAALLSEASGKNRKFCEDFIREFFRITADALANRENVRIRGFGTFKIVEVDARTGVNVTTGEKQEFAAHRKVVFTPAKEMASLINAPFELFESMEIEEEPSVSLPVSDISDYNLEESVNSKIKNILTEEVTNITSPDPVHLVGVPSGEENEINTAVLENGSIEEKEDDDYTAEAYAVYEEELNSEQIIVPQTVEIHNTTSDVDHEPITSEDANREDISEFDSEDIKINQNEINKNQNNKKVKFKYGFFAGAMTSLVICLIMFMLGCFFGWWPVNFGSFKQNVAVIDTADRPYSSNSDKILTEEINISQPEEDELATADSKVDTTPKVYDTVTTTRYLTTIAREHYGNFNFWPYIYLENESFLGHPDRIKPGTRIIVPPLSKYGVDPKNKADVAAAKRLSQEIYAKYR